VRYAAPVRPNPASPTSPLQPSLPRPLPAPEDLAALDVSAFLRRLDGNLAAISDRGLLAPLIPPAALEHALADPRFSHADELFRGTLRGSLVATSILDLPAEARVHPEVQRRLWSAMDEMDTAVLGIGKALESLSADERAGIGRALRDEPELGEAVLAALDARAEQAGVSGERRAHLRKTGEHACFRLRQSTPAFIEEQREKLGKLRPLEAAEAERYLAAQLGDTAFHQEKEWHLAVFETWQKVLEEQGARLEGAEDPGAGDGLSPDDAYAPPAGQGEGAPPSRPFNPDRGRTVLKVGAWLFGLGLFAGLTGALLVSGSGNDIVIAGLFSFTAAAVLSVAGVICLLVGAILRARARTEASYRLDE
jgi:hypothetical protein